MKHLFFAALAVSALSSCSDTDEVVNDIRADLAVRTALVQDGRAMETGTDFARSGVQIGVSLFKDDWSAYAGSAGGCINVPYTSTHAGGATTWSSASAIRLTPVRGKAVAYYPYRASTDVGAIDLEAASQTDYMYSVTDGTVTAMNPEALFRMHHALSAVDVTVRKSADYPFPGKVTEISVASSGFGTTGVLNAKTGGISGVAGQGTAVRKTFGSPLVLTADVAGISNPIMVVPDLAPTKSGMPVTIRMTVDGHVYKATGTMNSHYNKGCIYKFPVVLGPKGLEVASVTVTDWVQGPGLGDYPMNAPVAP